MSDTTEFGTRTLQHPAIAGRSLLNNPMNNPTLTLSLLLFAQCCGA